MSFHLEVTTLDEFIRLLSLVRLAFDSSDLDRVVQRLRASTNALDAAVAKAVGGNSNSNTVNRRVSHMASEVPAILKDVETEVARAVTVQASAVVLINGFAARMQAAIDKALAGGATAEQLSTVQDEVDAIRSATSQLAQAVADNTPGA